MTQKTYRGWSVDYDPKPIPHRGFDWSATSPDFDCDCEDGAFVICSGHQVSAASFEELCAEIDGIIENEAEVPASDDWQSEWTLKHVRDAASLLQDHGLISKDEEARIMDDAHARHEAALRALDGGVA